MCTCRLGLATLFCGLVVGGCLPTAYYYDGKTFDSARAALEQQARSERAVLDGVPTRATTLAATAIVVVPTLDRVKNLLVTTYGQGPPRPDFVEFVATSTLEGLEFMGHAIERRRIFDKVTIEHGEVPENVPGAAYVVYYKLVRRNAAGWYVKGGGFATPAPVLMDMGTEPGVPRTLAWLEYLEKTISEAPRGDSRSPQSPPARWRRSAIVARLIGCPRGSVAQIAF